MKRSDLRALGLTDEVIGKIQRIHQEDIKHYRQIPADKSEMRNAIIAMLPVIRRREHVRDILSTVNRYYYIETRYVEPQPVEADPDDEQPADEPETAP